MTNERRTIGGLQIEWFAAITLLMTALLDHGATRVAVAEGKTTPPQTVVRGSVEQIHVIHAKPKSEVTVEGPSGFRVTGSTDDRGGLVLRDVPPGNNYSVTVEGSDRNPESVRVLGREEHPDARFYASQKLEPTRGYIQTRDG